MNARSKIKVLTVGTVALAAAFVGSPSQARAQAALAAIPGSRPVAVLLCQYQDNTNTYDFTPASVLGQWMTNTQVVNGATVDDSINGLVADASGGLVDLQGTQAFGWFTLPQPLSGYGDMFTVATDCIAAAQAAGTDLTPFVYAVAYVNDTLPNGMSGSMFTNLPGPAAPTPPNPNWNRANTSIIWARGLTSPPQALHELAHLLGSNVHSNSGSDPVGTSWQGSIPQGPLNAGLTTYQIASVAMGWDASRRELFGFLPAASIATFAGGTQTFNLSRLAQPIAGVPVAIDVPMASGAKYVISARTQVGRDAYTVFSSTTTPPGANPGGFAVNTEGVRIELVSDAPGSTVPQADVAIQMSNPGGDMYGTDAVWLGCQSFVDAANGIRITVGSFTPGSTTSTAQIIVTSSGTPGTAPAPVAAGACAPPPAALVTSPDAAPLQDNLAAATAIVPPIEYNKLAFSTTFGSEAGEPLSCTPPPGGGGGSASKTGWVRFTPTVSGPLTALGIGATMLAVYSGPSAGATFANLVQVGCGAAANLKSFAPQATATFTAVAGQTYYLQAGTLGLYTVSLSVK